MIVVTGGAGVVGSRLVRKFLDRGLKVRVVTLAGDPGVERNLGEIDCEVFYGDVADAESLEGAFDGATTVFHLAAVIIPPDDDALERVNIKGTENVYEGAKAAGVKHFIYFSSISTTYPKLTEYARSKIAGEEMLKKQDAMEWTVIRPSLVYDEAGGMEFNLFKDFVMNNKILPMVGTWSALKNPVHTDDIVDACAKIPENPVTHGKAYNLCGSEELSLKEIAEVIVEHAEEKRCYIPIPTFCYRFAAAIMGKLMKNPPFTWQGVAGLSQDATPDYSRAILDLDYKPIGFREGWAKCAEIIKSKA